MEMNVTSPNSPGKLGWFTKTRERDNSGEKLSKKGEMMNRNGKMLPIAGEKRYN
jgi:hypothetical protein